MRGTSTRTHSSRHRQTAAARRPRGAGVLGALSVVVMAAALGTLVLDDGDTSAAGPVEVVASAGQATGRNAVIGTDRSNRPQRSTAVPTPSATPPAVVPETTTAAPTSSAETTAEPTATASRKPSATASPKASAKASPEPSARVAPKPSPEPAPKATPPPAPVPPPAPAPAAPAQLAAAGRTIQAYITGYTWHDNTPAGSPQISHPRVHETAGGTGTFDDPITVAVGHDKSSGRSVLDWPAGTRFYVPAFSRYLIVEDTCGDGGSPENGACHTGYPSSASTWLDVWIDGRDAGESASGRCAGAVTGVTAVVVDPAPGLPVKAGSLSSGGGCAV